MTYVLAQPQVMARAAADVAAIGSTIHEAAAAAAGRTTAVAAAAADEISAAVARLFNAYGQEWGTLIGRAAAVHGELARALGAAGDAYADTEAAGRAALAATSGSTAGVGGGAGALPAMTNAALGDPVVTFVLGGSGTPIPPQDFVTNVVTKYVMPNFPVGLVQALSMPAGEYPDSGIKDLMQNISIARGVTTLNNAIQQQLAAGNTVNVLGYSQGANIAALEMRLLDPGGTPSNLPINFVLLGNSMNPNGGWDARFPGLNLPTLGFSTLGPMPTNDFVTKVYTLEYDGWADFPRYPIDIFSDLNALAGMVTVHTGYDTLTSTQVNSAIVLPTQGPTQTTFYMIPNQNLPLLDPVRLIPYVGNPIADLVQPVLTPVVNWGYGDPNFGWSTGPANVTTPFGFLPPRSDTTALGPALISGIHQGIGAAIGDFRAEGPPQLPSLQDMAQALASGAPGSGTPALPAGPPTITDLLSGLEAANTQIVGAGTTAFSTAYSTLLPTADIATAALASLPSYDVNLFLNGIAQMVNGQPLDGLINAFGNPVAADVGLLPMLGGLEVAVLGEAGYSILTGTPYGSF
ncbi:PE family protein [Mycobacterium terramassiliense]|uniref:PE family protein n=1 Tax=Mycobacterium terramassiliense TaxID=1841859 RepID=A0A2U3NGR4_9MYCO|nr:PE-PPE domain-containing protein [Mycobacterium terramassiliense]SPM30680.1 PE family protein [Mycobacterium terramassiliense]